MKRLLGVVACAVLSAAGLTQAASFSVWQVGDSITAGTTPGGFRKPTLERLGQVYGHTVTTVGVQTDTSLPVGQRAHDGHGGWRIDQLNDNMLGANNVGNDGTYKGGYWLKGGNGTGRGAINPTFVTVMAGINDINGFIGNDESSPMSGRVDLIMNTLKGRMTALGGTLTSNLPNSTILMGGVIPFANGLINDKLTGANATQRNLWMKEDGVAHADQELGVNHFVILFNKWVRDTYVPQLQAQGKKVVYVDQYANYILPNGQVRGWNNQEPYNTYGPDGYGDYGLHPNQFGYNLMGRTWADAINAQVNAQVPEPTAMAAIGVAGVLLARRRRTA